VSNAWPIGNKISLFKKDFFYLFKIPAKTPEQPKKKHKINHFDFHKNNFFQ
jgi:hypothetical protein